MNRFFHAASVSQCDRTSVHSIRPSARHTARAARTRIRNSHAGSARKSAPLAPPIPVGPYFAYNEPVFVAPVYVAPVYVTPAYYQPVLPAPAMVVADWYAPTYVTPYSVSVRSSPWSYKAEFEYATPYGTREVEYRVDRHGRVRVDYDD